MDKAAMLDAADRKILRIIQKDACVSILAIASEGGLSQSPCWKRLKELAAQGVIKRRVALLDPSKPGLQMTVFVSIQVGEHSDSALARFAAEVASMEEVMDFYCLAGDADYGLRVVAADAAAFDAFYKRLIALMPLKSVLSRFALEVIKSETAFPVLG